MAIELISFKLCPFVQRAVITLKHKGIDFDVTYIDIADPPDWFLEISPLGKVPVLKVDGEILFESAVINEYLDDITGGELQPKDALARAKNRAWTEFASNLLGNLYVAKMAKDQEGCEKGLEQLVKLVGLLEEQLGDGPWFAGNDFTLADTSFAPFFWQDAVCDRKMSVLDAEQFPKTKAWADRLLALPEVQHSVVPEFESLYLTVLEKNDSYYRTQLVA